MTTATPCRSLYVHVPFCRHLCGYCDFYSQVLDPGLAPRFVDAALRELAGYAHWQALSLDTIYVGGGTPTVLPPEQLARLLSGLAEHAAPWGARASGPPGADGGRRDACAPRAPAARGEDLEFTAEANPATVSPEVAAILVATGVNRVSIGAQSFDAGELGTLDRTHQPAEVGQTVETCRRLGIRQINLDLIFGIPGQTLGSWRRSLKAALALGPDHLSCYGLTYESGTPLWQRLEAGLVTRLDEDLEAEMYEAALDTLPAAGLVHYEISNFSRPGAGCRHNLRYWHNEPHLGIGPAAAGYLDGVRYKNLADAAGYVQAVEDGRSPRSEQERLPPERRARETAMLELRLTAGIDREDFLRRFTREPVEMFSDAIERHVAGGLLVVDDASIRLTRAGLLVADTVIADFL